jgi:TPR repeat protein
MAVMTIGEEKYRFARSAASQRERQGFYRLGWCYEHGDGCEKDLEKAREYYLIAAQLGHVDSMVGLGRMLDPQKWLWWGRAAVLGQRFFVLTQLFWAGSIVQFGFWKRCCCVSDWQSVDWKCQCREERNFWLERAL